MDTQENTKKKFYKRWWFWVSAGVLVLISIISLSSSSSGTPTYHPSRSICDGDPAALKKEAFVPNYKQLAKDTTASQGTVATFIGQIVQIQQSGNDGVMRLSVTKESYGWSLSDIVYVTYHQPTTAVQGDVVSVTGMLTGTVTYTSQANFQITIPSIDVCSVDTNPQAQPIPTSQATQTTSVTKTATQTTSPAPTPAPTTPPPTPATWHTVNTFSGSGTQNTSPFTIRGSQWRIDWNATADNSDTYCAQNGCVFNIELFKPGSDLQQDYVQSEVNTTKSGTSYFYNPGQYYLNLSGSSITNWGVTVEDYY